MGQQAHKVLTGTANCGNLRTNYISTHKRTSEGHGGGHQMALKREIVVRCFARNSVREICGLKDGTVPQRREGAA